MTLPYKLNYTFIRGDSKTLKKFKILDVEGTELTLTDNDNIYFTVKKYEADTDAVITKTLSDAGIELGDDGYYHIRLEGEETEELEVHKYYYDIELYTTKFIRTILKGTINLLQDVTGKEQHS